MDDASGQRLLRAGEPSRWLDSCGNGDGVRLLTVNAGSTSTKVSVLDETRDEKVYDSLDAAIDDIDVWAGVDAVAHRVVHGGGRTEPVVIDDAVRSELTDLTDLAPLHQKPGLDAIDVCRGILPSVPQFACFDTSFHATLPVAARTYAVPQRLRERIRVYGFHGLSYAWAAARVKELAPEAHRVLVAHLGGGGSLCGLVAGRSVTTTMGFTPLDGLVMATRSGSLDPGALLWLARHTDEDLDHVLERESGLLGLCGTADMREVLRRAATEDAAAGLALEVYIGRLVRLLGGCVADMGGIDALVFTGGIGENSAPLRALICDRLRWLGVGINPTGDLGDGSELTTSGATVRTFVVHAREDRQMFTEVAAMLARSN